jgi:hypothetical protein
MSLTYGYDLKNDDDDMIAVPVQLSEILARFFVPGMALVNSLPFCTIAFVIIAILVSHNDCFQ